MYREHGKAGYDLPTIRTRELDVILAEQFQKLVKHQRQIIRLVIDSITDAARRRSFRQNSTVGSTNTTAGG